ncbi:uncharacterized protein LOC130775944 [Actinidia eriantha]|uniref:uncharacterized protein LOC130775944 n=1 Tax=Actinidia eriantha TaxID=165200 RepID=UPI0025873709|nr:uncharacterized protein LOC130775944 [Actinidia eriantha]
MMKHLGFFALHCEDIREGVTLCNLTVHSTLSTRVVEAQQMDEEAGTFWAKFLNGEAPMGWMMHTDQSVHFQDFRGSWEDHLPLVKFAYNNSYQSSIEMAPYEALYGRPCRSPMCWSELGEATLVGPELVAETAESMGLIRKRLKAAQEVTTEKVKVIRQRLLTAQSHQKSYADRRRRLLSFDVGDHVFLKISPRRSLNRFGRGGKLSPRYIGPFDIIEKIREVAYRLALPLRLSGIHDVFHVSMLKKYELDPSHILEWSELELEADASYGEKPIRIIDMREKMLRGKTIRIVRVLWNNFDSKESTWERKDEMSEKHPELFNV